jgi:hemolysin activation/secretion protein
MPFNQKLLNQFDYKINSLPFAQSSLPTAIYFYGNKAKPYLVLNPVKASTFDGIIGFAPKSSINNQLVLTGDFKLKLCNLWGTGLQLETVFKSYLVGSKELEINTEIPYIQKIKLGLNYAFKLLKFDSLYLELNHEFAYRFIDRKAVQLNIVYSNNQFKLINADTNWVRLYKTIPKINDALSNQIGLDFTYRKINHIQYPSKGIILQLRANINERQIVKNSSIEAVQFLDNNGQTKTVYSNKNLTSYQFHFFADLNYYLPINKLFIVKCQLNSALIQANQLLQQEQFRIGGLKTLKGFDEQSLFTNKYILANIEWRYLLPQNSSFILFYNQAWMNNQLSTSNANSIANGFGAGMQINTSNGQLSIYYALGKINNAEFNFNAAKIHFGYNQLF